MQPEVFFVFALSFFLGFFCLVFLLSVCFFCLVFLFLFGAGQLTFKYCDSFFFNTHIPGICLDSLARDRVTTYAVQLVPAIFSSNSTWNQDGLYMLVYSIQMPLS